ncbi:hypothetical protein KHP62_03745 [Rhodobacteraceae bacterium NNCM2]|nr:hypothetical protein [Coraliihabitans acroporae]
MKRLLLIAALVAGPALAQVAPQTGEAVRKWDGADHAAYFGDPLEWARFQMLLTSEEFREVRLATEGQTRAQVTGGHLVLTGCFVQACTSTRAGLAVEVESGKPFAVIWQRDREPRIFGAQDGKLPRELEALAQSGALQ